MKTTHLLVAILALSPLAASAASAAPAADHGKDQWTTTFEQMIEVHQAIKSLTKKDGQAAVVLKKRFAVLRASLTAIDVKVIQARSKNALTQTGKRMEIFFGGGSDGPEFFDEASWKASISGGDWVPPIEKKTPVEEEWVHPDDWKNRF
ncbi:MAG: hypothetical protein COB53_13080 [Elusimicrobia bacterium]|nr:MAG: hypothetical protein COB53_13080 [Elusimicrobiota bacterium]